MNKNSKSGGKQTTLNGGAFEKQTKLDEILLNNKFEIRTLIYKKRNTTIYIKKIMKLKYIILINKIINQS